MQVFNKENLNIEEIVSALKEGKTVVYPTETSYGLGADATNEEAVQKIFKIKKRQENKAVVVLMSDIEMARKYVEWSPEINELAEKYWPGPLNVVAKIKNSHNLSPLVIGEDNTLAFRISSHPVAKEMVDKLNKPLVSTSANISSNGDPYSAQDIVDVFSKEDIKPDIIIDAGELPEISPSTIVQILDGSVKVLRQGQIKI